MLQFLTKFPLPFKIEATSEDFSKGIIWFPFAGGLIGLCLYGLSYLPLSSLVVSVVIVAFLAFITGGLHLDGLADTFDGLYSYRDKERMLEIMKDSRVGTNGVLILIIGLLLKVVLINELLIGQSIFLIAMPAFARFMAVSLAKFSRYARPSGMGAFFIGKTSLIQWLIALVMTLGFATLDWILLIPLVCIFGLTFLYRYHVYSKIDGITGDVLGAWIELSEILFLLIMVII
jgi:adenosylcobinamide-GDP ribazoletransferase